MKSKIRLYLDGNAYRVYLGNSRNLYLGKISEIEAKAILSDITLNQFDNTLERYKPTKLSDNIKIDSKSDIKNRNILDIYKDWVLSLNKPIEPYKGHYQNIYLILKKLDNYKNIELGLKELSKHWSNGTYRTYRACLTSSKGWLTVLKPS